MSINRENRDITEILYLVFNRHATQSQTLQVVLKMYFYLWSSLSMAWQLHWRKKPQALLSIFMVAANLINVHPVFGFKVWKWKVRAGMCDCGCCIPTICTIFTNIPLLSRSYQHNNLGMLKLEQNFIPKIVAKKVWKVGNGRNARNFRNVWSMPPGPETTLPNNTGTVGLHLIVFVELLTY